MTSVIDKVRTLARVVVPDTSADARLAKIVSQIATLEAEQTATREQHALARMREEQGATVIMGVRRPSADLADRCGEIDHEIRTLENQRRLLIEKVREEARTTLLSSESYRETVRESWRRWREQLAPHIALADTHDEATRNGIKVPSIPQPLGLQVVAFRAWTNELRQAGTLSEED